MPHRHRHRVPGTARGAHDGVDRPGLVGCRPGAWPPTPVRTSTSCTRRSTRHRRCSDSSTSCSRVSVRCAGSPDIDRWAGVVADLLVPGGGSCSCGGSTRCCGLWTTRTRIGLCWPVLRAGRAVGRVRGADLRRHRAATSELDDPQLEPRDREIVTALLDHGLHLTQLVEHDSVPWNPLPTQMVERDAEWVLAEHPNGCPDLHAAGGQAPVMPNSRGGPPVRVRPIAGA